MDSSVKHIAVIPDGNRRWAKSRSLKPWEGHTEGIKRFWDISESAVLFGVEHLTFWVASYDNLTKRSTVEIQFLIALLRNELQKSAVKEQLLKNQTRLRIVGEWNDIINDAKLAQKISNLEGETAHFNKTNITILFGYDGQREMLQAINSLEHGKGVDDNALRSKLWTGFLPDVDLVIRTGGEPHWSAGFMMWLTANSQFYFTDMLWPDFEASELKKALEEFERRERRLGK